jgi:hypothetical protein
MQQTSELESQAHLLRLKLNKLRQDINKHRTPLELRIARTLFEDRQNKINVKKNFKIPARNNRRSNNKNNTNTIRSRRKRPDWGAGNGSASKNCQNTSKTGGYSKKQVFSTPSQVNIEYDEAVLVGRKDIETNENINCNKGGPKWHCVMGKDAKEILMMQSDKMLGKAYEFLRKESRDTEYPGLISSAKYTQAFVLNDFQAVASNELSVMKADIITNVEVLNGDWTTAELNGQRGDIPTSYIQFEDAYREGKNVDKSELQSKSESENVIPRQSSASVTASVTASASTRQERLSKNGYIPVRANATSAEMLRSEAHRWLQRGRLLLKCRLEEVSNKMKQHEEKMKSSK